MQAYLTIHILAYFQNDWKYLVVVEKYQKNENFLTPALKKKTKNKNFTGDFQSEMFFRKLCNCHRNCVEQTQMIRAVLIQPNPDIDIFTLIFRSSRL